MKVFICALILCAASAQASVLLRSPLVYSTAYSQEFPTFIDNSHLILNQAPAFPIATNLYNAPLVLPSLTEGINIAKTPGSAHITSLSGQFTSIDSIKLPEIKKDDDKKDDSVTLLSAAAFPRTLLRTAVPLSYAPLIVQAPQIISPTEGTYVAKNLGVEHTAPLPGHFISTTSLNLEKAPGSL